MGSLKQTVNMKTTFISLACVLVMTGANLRKKCNNKAEKISSQDCKQYCNVSRPAKDRDCGKCVWKHQDYDKDCQGMKLEKKCFKTEEDIAREDCKCTVSTPRCFTCVNNRRFKNYLESGIACEMLITLGVTFPPFHPTDDVLDYFRSLDN